MTARRPSVALIGDHPQRDLAGLVLTAVQLCQGDVDCHLVPHNLEEGELFALAPDLVLLNFFRPVNQALARRMVRAGIQVGVLDTEGGVWPDEAAYVELLWQDAELRRQLRCVCLWGPRLAHYLVTHGLLSVDQVAVTGCPRFDFYHRDWRSALHATEDRAASRILINTNFSMCNPRFATVAQNVGQAREAFGLSAERVAALIDAERDAITAMIQLAGQLSRDYPTAEIVFRPHPFEDTGLYRRRLRDANRIVVDNGGPVQPEIGRADVVIQRSCSTGVEAGLAGVPTLSPQWVPAPTINPMAERVSVPCDSYDDMRARLDAIFAGTYDTPPEIRDAIDCVTRDWFCRADGLAHSRVSAAVLARLGGSTVDRAQCERELHGLVPGPRRGTAWLGRTLRYRLGLPTDWSFRRMRRVPARNKPGKSFGLGDVRALVDRIQQAPATRGTRRVTVSAADADPGYRRQLLGQSITLACEGAAPPAREDGTV